VIYIGLFFIAIFGLMFFSVSPFGNRSGRSSEDIDLIQLERKIKNSELKQLTIKPSEIVALDRVGEREYRTWVTNESTRAEILKEARQVNANGQPRVPRVEEETGQPAVSPFFPIGIVVLFCAHAFTILLSIALMPLYIILAVKSSALDQTMRIVWVILICMLGMFAMPVYWYLYIWRGAPPTTSVPNSSNAREQLSL
jgi:ATP-dependent Zn protease